METWSAWRDSQKKPLKVNLFEQLVSHTGTLELVPIFPYLGPGDVVTCASSIIGGPSLEEFIFTHNNVIPETMIVVSEAGGAVPLGTVMALLGEHAVTSGFLAEPHQAGSFFHVLVAVRMLPGSVQDEEFIINCPKCGEEVFRHGFNIKAGPERPLVGEFYGLFYYDQAVQAFNQTERVCAGCLTVLPRFPEEQMGWGRYAANVATANQAGQRLQQAMEAALQSTVRP